MLYFLRKNLKSFLKLHCRPFYCIWYGQRKDTWKKTRFLCSALAGALCAFILCKILFSSFVFPNRFKKSVMSIAILVISFGFMFTDATKCIIYLIFIALMGKSGRSYIRALCFALVIAGPLENLSSNAGEIVRVFSCSKMLTFNLTRTRFDLMTKPFRKTLSHMKDDIKEVQKTFSEFRNVTQAVHKEIMEDDPPLTSADFELAANNHSSSKNPSTLHRLKTAIRNVRQNVHVREDLTPEYAHAKYKNKFRKRCIQQLDGGKARCRKAFDKALQNCRDKMPIILKTLLCWPMKIDFVCQFNILGDPDKLCDPSDAIPDSFGGTYVELVQTEKLLYENNSDVKVHYATFSPETVSEFESAKETAKSVGKEFNRRKRMFDSILVIFEQVLAFMVIKLIFVSISYHKQYNRDINHDNIYISEYFKCIDQDRKSRGKSTILPLRKFEKSQLVDVANVWQRTREESRTVAYYLLQFALETVTALFFLFLDYLIVTILLVIRTNSHVAFVQEGEHTIHFSIQGSGLIARLLRTTMKNFNMHETVSTYMTNEQCLPRPSILPRDYYLKLFGLYALVIFLIYQSATILRMRRLICAYFYRKREKRRIIYLYNLLLRQKRSVMEKMLKQAKLNFANRKIRLRANIFLKLRLKYPRHFGWLRRFNVARRKCVICDEFEDENFTFCSSPLCGVSYCNHCWMDMGNQCLVCNEVISVEMILNFNDFFEEFPFV